MSYTMNVTDPLTNEQLRAAPVPVDIGGATISVGGNVNISNEVEVKNDTGNPVPVSGTLSAIGYQVATSTTFTRPADTTQYAANDAVTNSTSAPTILEFTNAARVSGGSGLILSARHIKNNTATTNASFRLWIYRSTATAVNDNAQFPLLWANRANRIGFVDFTHTTQGTGSDSTSSLVTFVNLPFVAAGTSLFGLLTATAAYTPASGEQHYVELSVVQN